MDIVLMLGVILTVIGGIAVGMSTVGLYYNRAYREELRPSKELKASILAVGVVGVSAIIEGMCILVSRLMG